MKADGGLENTLTALDLFLQSTAPLEKAVDVAQDTVALEVEDKPEVAPPAPTPAANTPAAQTPLSGKELREGDAAMLQSLFYAAWELATNWVKNDSRKWITDKVKPTSIVEEDENLPRAQPTFAYLMLLANLVVYGAGLTRLAQGPGGTMDYFLSLAEVNEAVEAGEYYRIVSANFLHDSFVHLGVSSYALLTIAPEAEAVLGSFAFLTTYILGGVAGTAVCFLLTDTVTVGPSSGIFALIGAMGAFLYKNHKAPKTSEGLFYTAGLLAFNLCLGHDRSSAVDNLGHMGGLLCGIYLGVLLSPMLVDSSLGATSGPGSPSMGGQSPSATLQPPPVDAATAPPQPLEPVQSDPISPESVSSQPEASPSSPSVHIVQPNLLQSLVVVGCVATTLACSVALTVIHRTGHLPPPKWPF